ncbi:DUF2330 domain-containing protein [Aestuariimicrobium sp. Y1814]|uniref:DUF2330 domain-containing protein n=1 Tax=Aestuariimicrobium sp. Y1814 TaxID=3418742 RepID=UPI003DA724B9
MRRLLVRLVAATAAAMLLVAGLLVGPQQAVACACGAVVSDGTVTGEVAIVAWDGTRQSIDLQMLLGERTEDAGWIMPTPSPAEISLGADAAFTIMADVSAPRVVVKRVFRPSLSRLFLAGSDGAPREVGARVLSTTRVGPFTVATLSGTDATEVNLWLGENGYPSRDDLVPTFQKYLDQGWVLQAVKLTAEGTDAAFEDALPTLRMTFETAEPVYPLRLSRHAKVHQDVRLYLLSAHPMAVAQQAGPHQLTLLFSGKVPNQDLRNPLLIGEQVHLTTYEATYEPEDIVTDLTFAQDPSMVDYQREHITYHNVAGPMITLAMFAMLLLAPLALIVVVVARVTGRAARRE